MIICFSGNGNSRRVADMLQDALGDELMRPAPGYMNNPRIYGISTTDTRIIWIMPVHAWGLPRTVKRVMRGMKLDAPADAVHHLIFTCGDDIGHGDRQWRKVCAERGWTTGCAFSVQMPNTYTFMPGFDVDSDELAKAKLAAVPERVEKICADILSDEKVTDVVPGSWAWLKTNVFHPWFMRYKLSTKPFHANDDCMACGKCSRNCSHNNIQIVDGKPVWGNNCTMCARCYHCCPRHAVQYGKVTKNKGQYICPGFTLKD